MIVLNTDSNHKLVDQEVHGHAAVYTAQSRGERAASKHNASPWKTEWQQCRDPSFVRPNT
jgi:hypothetical protein